MAGILTHSPADVVRRALIGMGLGTLPTSNGEWPISVAEEPDTPDNAVTVFDTSAKDDGRTHPDGERAEHHGFQLRIRAVTFSSGYSKARQFATALDAMYQQPVSINGVHYLLWEVARTSDVIWLGTELQSERKIWTINGLATVRQVAH